VLITTNVVSSNASQARCTRYNICDKVCQWLATGRWFPPGIPVSSTNKTSLHDITEILLKHHKPNQNKTNYAMHIVRGVIRCIYNLKRQEPEMLEWELLDKERKQSYTANRKEKYLTTLLKQKSKLCHIPHYTKYLT
jgi:hypothetical protein